jgi:hypothetical protein
MDIVEANVQPGAAATGSDITLDTQGFFPGTRNNRRDGPAKDADP